MAHPVISTYETGQREPGLAMLSKLVEGSGHRLQVDSVAEVASGAVCRTLPQGVGCVIFVGRSSRAAERRGATNVRVFGSVARGDDTSASDVDLLVDLRDGVGIVGLIGLEREIAETLKCDVDVEPFANLKTGLASQALAEAIRL